VPRWPESENPTINREHDRQASQSRKEKSGRNVDIQHRRSRHACTGLLNGDNRVERLAEHGRGPELLLSRAEDI
jgi:hypothetical protein